MDSLLTLEGGIPAEDEFEWESEFYDDELNLLPDIRVNIDVDSPPSTPTDRDASCNIWDPYHRRNTHARLIAKNIHESVTAEEIEKAFEQCGPVIRVRILENEVTGEPTGSVIIQFRDTKSALNAFTRMQDFDVWWLHPDDDLKARQTIRVRNLPPWARPADVMEWLENLGEIRTVIMPKGEDSDEDNAGWAAVQFACEEDAKVAIDFANGAMYGGQFLRVDMARLADF